MIRGEVHYLFAFDVGNEILLGNAEAQPMLPHETRRPQLAPHDLSFSKPQSATPPSGTLDGQIPRIDLRIFGVGAIAISIRIPVQSNSLDELRRFHELRYSDGRPMSAVAREICETIRASLGDAIRNPVNTSEPEAYTVFCLTDLGGEENANRWLELNRREVAGLLGNLEAGRLSDGQVNETLRYVRSLENSDFAAIDWDAALVVDLAGIPEEVIYVIELANLQLQELRVLDAILDRHLNRIYDQIGQSADVWSGNGSTALKESRRLRVDIAKLADEVTNITKFVGDWFLARVYLSAKERFHLDEWRASLETRLAQIDRLYGVLHAEANERRMLWLEVAIVVMILIELLITFFGKR